MDYTTKQVSKLTGLSPRQLQYLDEQGHVPATTVAGNGRAGQRRSWSEGQLKQMLRLAGIRKKYKLHFKSIPPSGKVGCWLYRVSNARRPKGAILCMRQPISPSGRDIALDRQR